MEEENKVIVKLKKQPLKSEREEIMQEKKKKRVIIVACVLLFIVGVAIGSISMYFLKNDVETTTYSKLDEIKSYLKNVWLYRDDYEDIDTELEDKAYYGMTSFDDDPYTTYMSSEELSSYASSINMNYVGIGVSYNVNNFTIIRVYKDSPAENGGLLAGDKILKVDGESIDGKTSDEVKSMVTGEEGTTVDITVLRDGEEIAYTIVRGNVDNTVYATKEDGYVYLEIMSFGTNTGNECIKYLDEYKDESKIIIDLRNNTGGYEKAVQEVAGVFLGKDKVVMHKVYSKTNIDTDYTISNAYYDNFKDIVILTNGSTASAAEVLTICLKEQHDNVTIVGKTTYGKGVMQTSYSLSDGSAIKVTTAYWTSPNEVSINKTGINPDVEIDQHPIMSETIYTFEEDDSYTYDSVSNYVLIMQESLDYLGYDVDRTDGYFSKQTENALNKFKADHNLDEDGVLDYKTYNEIYSVVASTNTSDTSKDNQLMKAVEIING